MIRLNKIYDKDAIKIHLKRDEIYKNILGVDSMDDVVLDTTCTSYLLVSNNSIDMGILILRDFSSNCISFHGGTYKQYRGSTKEILKVCLERIKNDLNCVLVTTILEFNEPAISLVKKLGFTEKCRIKNGSKVGDILLFGEE